MKDLKPGDMVIYIGGHTQENTNWSRQMDSIVGKGFEVNYKVDDSSLIDGYDINPEEHWTLLPVIIEPITNKELAVPRSMLMKIDPDQGIKEEVNEIINKIPKEILA